MKGVIKYLSVKKLIDKNISDKLSVNSLSDMIIELNNRIIKFTDIVKRDYSIDVDIDMLKLDNKSILDKYISSEDTPSRLKYNIYYILHCRSRIDDFLWIKNIKSFSKLSDSRLFGLIQLRDKLSLDEDRETMSDVNREIFKCDIGGEIKTLSGTWIPVTGYAMVNDEPRYIIPNPKGWLSLAEVKHTHPVLLQGTISPDGNSFRMVSAEYRNTKSEEDNKRLTALLSQVKVNLNYPNSSGLLPIKERLIGPSNLLLTGGPSVKINGENIILDA